MKSIFVQIASYRDPELVPTIKNLIEQATHPERLKLCIAHQYSEEDEWDNLDQFASDGRFIVIQIPHTESQGVCWARNQIQQHYNGEDYTLQIDSHHRFVKGWDKECISTLNSLIKKGHKKPLLTSRVPGYFPATYPKGIDENSYGMSIKQWDQGVPLFSLYNPGKQLEPTASRFYSGHFAFTLGRFCKEVPHDPLMYFNGEEISIAVRAYTHGYDLFILNKPIAWHDYAGENRARHWDDNANWGARDNQSKSRVRQLLGVNGEVCSPCNKNTFKEYGLGEERTLEQYELYSGIKFRDQTVTNRCQQNISPPGTEKDSIYEIKKNYSFKINKNDFIYDDYVFAIIIIENSNGEVVHNDMIKKDEIQALKGHSKSFVQVNRQLMINNPLRYLIWPYSQRQGWGDKLISYF
jgi:hypothetical protein